MKRLISLLLLCLAMQLVWAQSGVDYNPQSPSDPTIYYRLTGKASPSLGGDVYCNSGEEYVQPGSYVYCYCYAKEGYKFEKWMIGDSLVSTNSSFYLTMPDEDVVLTAYFSKKAEEEYNPASPGDPQYQEIKKRHKVTFYSSPSTAGGFNSSTVYLSEGETFQAYAYPNSSYRFSCWKEDGKIVSTSNPMTVTMGEEPLEFTAQFVYEPQSPADPNSNNFDEATGSLIVDKFTPGELSSAIYATLGNSSTSDVYSIIVSGETTSYDLGLAYGMDNCTTIDLSRTSGCSSIPSYQYSDYTQLSSIYLPSGIKSIESYAFYGCSNLTDIYCYALTPPTTGYRTFEGCQNVIVHVPANSIPLYNAAEGWKDFTILPLDEETKSITVNLPDEAGSGVYKNMYLELDNITSGQTHRLLLNSRTSYTFSNLVSGTNYNVYVKTSKGYVLGSILNVGLEDSDTTVSFTSLKPVLTAQVKVTNAKGENLTSQTSVSWLDTDGETISTGSSASGLLDGMDVVCKVALNDELGVKYVCPDAVTATITESSSTIVCQLDTVPLITLTGSVIDMQTQFGVPMASVSATSVVNGKYRQSASVSADKSGKYSLAIRADKEVTLSASADNYIFKESAVVDVKTNGNHACNLDLTPITGSVVSVNYSFTGNAEKGSEQTVSTDYSELSNSSLYIYDKKKQTEITDYSYQGYKISLNEKLQSDDDISITVKSTTGSFNDYTADCIIGEDGSASVDFNLVSKGDVKASYTESGNTKGVVGILYDGNGKYVSKKNYASQQVRFSTLEDGRYSLVTIAKSDFYNDFPSLESLSDAGLTEGEDYRLDTLSVCSGVTSVIDVDSVPYFSESKFYYTTQRTMFWCGTSNVNVGNYVTLKAKVEFKPTYTARIQNARFIVDIPEDCQYVSGSLLCGKNICSEVLENGRLSFSLESYSVNDELRFCAIPLASGSQKFNAYLEFTFKGETITQPLGSVDVYAKSMELTIPSTVSTTNVTVKGLAPAGSTVTVYDNNTAVATLTSPLSGNWSAKVELFKPYNFSYHDFYAVAEYKGNSLTTETKRLCYDPTANKVVSITMSHYNEYARKNMPVTYYCGTGTTSARSFDFYHDADFTFTVQLENNDTASVADVTVYAWNQQRQYTKLRATYMPSIDRWVARGHFEWATIPVNASATFTQKDVKAFNTDEQLEDEISQLTSLNDAIDSAIVRNYVVDILQDDDNYSLFSVINAEKGDSVLYSIRQLDYNETVQMASEQQFEFLQTDSTTQMRLITLEGNEIKTIIIDSQNQIAFEITINADDLSDNTAGAKSRKNKSLQYLRVLWKSGKWMEIPGNIKEFAEELLGIKKYFECSQFETWCDILDRNVDALDKYSDITTKLITKKCSDGSYRLTEGDREKYYNQLQNVDNLISRYSDLYCDYLDMYVTRVRCSILYDIALTIAGGKAGKWIGKAGEKGIGWIAKQGIVGKLLSKPINNKFFSKIIPNTQVGRMRWLKTALGLGFDDIIGKASDFVKDYINPILNPEFADFESVSSELNNWSASQFNTITNDYVILQKNIKASYKKCPKKDDSDDDDDDNDSDDDDPDYPNTPNVTPVLDPSGYVYECVADNRLAGVTATCYYRDSVENMYGDIEYKTVKWDAEEYEQENPLITNEEGRYAWDVPQGMWQVKFEKEGYETTYSEWLPVPPPQLDVNIPMTQCSQPHVTEAHAYEGGIEVGFDKYMAVSSLTKDNIRVSQNGNYVDGTLKYLNEEKSETDTEGYASKVRFEPADNFSASYDVVLLVSNNVKSYAGVTMEESFTQEFPVEHEITSCTADSAVTVLCGDKKELTVSILPCDAAKGKTVTATSLSTDIVTLLNDTTVVGEDGVASFTVKGIKPGTSAVSYSIEGYDITGVIVVKVVTEADIKVANPYASVVTGSVVEEGDLVYLKCITDSARILYTLDGTCPCDNSASVHQYDGTPIKVTKGTTVINAMATKEGMFESDVVTFIYTTIDAGVKSVIAESIKVYPRVTKDYVNIEVPETMKANIIVTDLQGQNLSSRKQASGHIKIDLTTKPKGMYVIGVSNSQDHQAYKIIKEK